jgi:hypothetical protein
MERQAAGSTRLPGQSYAENQIGAQTARSTNAITQTGGSTGEIISGLSSIDSNAREATNDLGFQAAQLNQRNKELYSGVLGDVSEEQKDIFDYNKNQPYQTKSLQAQSLRDASSRNSDNAFSSVQDAAENIGVANSYRKANKLGYSTRRKPSLPDYNNTYDQV